MKKKTLALMLAVVLLVGVAAGSTLAWLTDQTAEVKNTFTVGTINIDLEESDDLDLKMIPGKTITKDPFVTVEEGSEASWLFVKVEKSSNFDDFMTYEIAADWIALEGADGVYYREVEATTAADVEFVVLKDDQVTVKEDVTKEMLDALTEETYPTLTFTAYACQKDLVESAADAWTILNPTT